jgi:hypothetical protein
MRMTSLFKRTLIALPVTLVALAALAEPAPPVASPGVEIIGVGVYCRPEIETTEDAPETELGYVGLLPGVPELVFQQQEIPARLGISFGIITVTDRDIPGARMETWRPGAERPDIWYSDVIAGSPRISGFGFDFANELITGTWRMEAWEGDTRLYSVEFEVLPGTALPGVSSDCSLLS